MSIHICSDINIEGGLILTNRFENKVVLVTGAGSGLGKAAAMQIDSEGAKLSMVDINSENLKEAKKEILKTYPNTDVLLSQADVSSESEVKNYVDKTVKTYGKIDAFFNNAGIEG